MTSQLGAINLARYEIPQIAEFGSIDAALKALKGNRHAVETGNDERYTPAHIIEAAREVMGAIDFDPASSAKAQETVRAGAYCTAEDDGLDVVWDGRVWLNPPWSVGLVRLFVPRFLEADIEAGVILLNNVADTQYGQRVLAECEAVCFTERRLNFAVADGGVRPGSGTVGQMIGYRGQDTHA